VGDWSFLTNHDRGCPPLGTETAPAAPVLVAGRIVRGSRRLLLRLAQNWPWAAGITAAIARLQAIPSG
jgi:hypothetical protein